jgi:hypothetical protein
MLSPLLAYVACFSQSRIMYAGRFQTLSSVWLVMLLIACLRYLQLYRRRDLLLIALAETLALYSAPSDALLGVVLIVLCGCCLLGRPDFRVKQWFGWHAPWLLLFLPSTAWIAIQYHQAGTIAYSVAEVATRSLSPLNVVVPWCGWSRLVWERWAPGALAGLWPGGFMGSGVMLGTAIAGLVGLHGVWSWRRRGGNIAGRLPHLGNARVLAVLFLTIALLATLALASGPSDRWPTLLVCLRGGLPGFTSIREPIRFSPTAQIIWLGLLFLGWMRLSDRYPRWLFLVLLIGLFGLQVSETVGVQAKTTRVFEEELALSVEEHAAFAPLSGSVWMVPCAPFAHNVRSQFFLQPLPELVTVNGYSGRSSELFTQLMELEATQGRLSEDQLELVKGHGVTYLVVVKCHVTEELMVRARQSGAVVFELPRFLAIRLPSPHPDTQDDV